MNIITRIKGGTDNCYIISEGRNAILVDTSSAPARDMVTLELMLNRNLFWTRQTCSKHKNLRPAF